MFVLIWMNFLRHDEHFDNVFYSYSVALCPAHAAPHAGGQHQSYVPFRIVSVGRYVPLYHNTSHVRPYIRQWVSCLHTTSVTECLLTPYQCSIAILHLSLSVRRNPTCANECPFATLHAPMNVPSPHYIRHWVSRRFTQILTYFVRICQMLPMFGRCFQTARFARFLRTLTAFSRYFLAHIFLEFGRFWQFWHMLPDFARFWQILTDFHRFW